MEPVAVLVVQELLHVIRVADVVHRPVGGVVLGVRLPRLAHLRPVHDLGEHRVEVSAEVRARLFPGRHEEVGVGRLLRRQAVVAPVVEPQRARVVRIHVAVEIAQPDDVEAHRLHRLQVRELVVQRPERALPLGEPEVEVVNERLVARDRLELVTVGEGEHILACGLRGAGPGVEVHRHPLHGARRRVVQREVLDVARVFFTIVLPHADAELVTLVVPVPHVTEIDVHFPCPEEGVGRRKRRDRPALAFCDQHAVGGPHRDPRVIRHAAEPVLLRVAAEVVPHHTRQRVGRKAAQAPFVDVGDRVLFGLGNRLHPHEVRVAIDREPQVAGEDAHRQARKGHLQARAIRLHAARRGGERRIHVTDFLRRARETPVPGISALGHAGNEKRRVPEDVPLLSVDHLLVDFDARPLERP